MTQVLSRLLPLVAFAVLVSALLPPIAGAQTNITVCVLRGVELTEVNATVDRATGDTTVAGTPFSTAFPTTTPPYAASSDWLADGSRISGDGMRYWKVGSERVIRPHQLMLVGESQGVPLFAAADSREPHAVLYVPVRPGCVFQPYPAMSAEALREEEAAARRAQQAADARRRQQATPLQELDRQIAHHSTRAADLQFWGTAKLVGGVIGTILGGAIAWTEYDSDYGDDTVGVIAVAAATLSLGVAWNGIDDLGSAGNHERQAEELRRQRRSLSIGPVIHPVRSSAGIAVAVRF